MSIKIINKHVEEGIPLLDFHIGQCYEHHDGGLNMVIDVQSDIIHVLNLRTGYARVLINPTPRAIPLDIQEITVDRSKRRP